MAWQADHPIDMPTRRRTFQGGTCATTDGATRGEQQDHTRGEGRHLDSRFRSQALTGGFGPASGAFWGHVIAGVNPRR
jgi:hypothetical protein